MNTAANKTANRAVLNTKLKNRLFWILQPVLFILVIYFWVLNPAVVDTHTLGNAIGWAFAFGVGIALVAKGQAFLPFLQTKPISSDVYQKNRVPQEFYWGHKDQTLFNKEKSE